MKLSHLLHKELILWDVDITSTDGLYDWIAANVSAKFKISEKEIKQAFIEREELGYTVFPDKSVIPHGRIEDFDDLIIAVVKTKKPILISGSMADIFYCILTTNSGSNRYLKTLASFAKIAAFHAEDIRRIRNTHDFMKFIEEGDFELDNIMRIKDIMNDQLVTVRLDDTIAQVADLMKKHSSIFLPVVDDQDKYLGKIDILDVIKIIYPDYMNLLLDVSFMSNLRGFEDYQEEEKVRTVAQLYSKAPKKVINQEEYAVEAGYILEKNRWHHITVVDNDNKVVSVFSTRTILNHILRV